MRSCLAGVALAAITLSVVSGVSAQATTTESPKSRACWESADRQALQGVARTKAHAACMNAPLAPSPPPPRTAAAEAVTAPSGAERATRARQCDDQAGREGLQGNALQAFRQSCIASAAPVGAVGSMNIQPAPTPAKPKLDALTDTPAQ